jgi:Pectate lyase superfamily protein
VPWTSYNYVAGNMTNGGGATIVGPPAQLSSINATLTDTIQMEATGGKAVQLNGTGQYAELTAQAAANSIVVRYCVPDTATGGGTNYTISLYTNGIFAQKLPVNSQYTWLYGSFPFVNTPGSGSPRNFFDEVRLTGLTINPGDTVTIEEDADDTAAFYVIDLVDLENVAPPPLSAPANSLNVTGAPYNADTNGVIDATAALQSCVNVAANGGMTVWMPPGQYLITGTITLPPNGKIQGAGMWYTTLIGSPSLYNTSSSRRVRLIGNSNANNISLSDFAITGFLNYRNDNEPNDGLGGTLGTNSTISRIWVVHTKTGIWLENANGLVIDSCRLRNTIADGINLNTGMRGTIVTNCTTRSTGDDCFAVWPESGSANYVIGLNVFTHCTGQLAFLANGGALYGAVSNRIEDCAFTDMPYGCGIYIAGTFGIGSGNGFSGLTVAQRCDLTRCGGRDPNGWSWRAALTIVPGSGGIFQNITNLNINHINITNSLCYAVEVLNNASSGVVSNATMNLVNISNYGLQVAGVYGVWAGLWNGHSVASSLNIEGLTVNGNAISSMPTSGTDVVNQVPLTFTFNFIPEPNITWVVLGGVLQLSWPAPYIGWTLQSQTNGAGFGIGPDWGIVSGTVGTNQFSTPLDPTTGSSFFRLIDQ